MSDLSKLQKDFYSAFRDKSEFETYIKKNKVSAENRFGVYQTNITEALRKTLENTFPLTWQLIGQECADGAAYTYIHEGNLPQSGNLDDWGASFPEFLKSFAPVKNLGYLSDFAKLEWLKHLSLISEDAESLSLQELQTISPEAIDKLVLKLHPSVHLLSSKYPLDQVLEVVEGKVDSTRLDETRGADVLLQRPNLSLTIHWLPTGYFTPFKRISMGSPLQEAFNESEINLQEFLSFALHNKVFSSYRIK